jgi:hypothetical protein
MGSFRRFFASDLLRLSPSFVVFTILCSVLFTTASAVFFSVASKVSPVLAVVVAVRFPSSLFALSPRPKIKVRLEGSRTFERSPVIEKHIKGLFTRQSDFALGLQVCNTNNIFYALKWTSLLQNSALKLDV